MSGATIPGNNIGGVGSGGAYQQNSSLHSNQQLSSSSSYSTTSMRHQQQLNQCGPNKVDATNYAMSDDQLFKSAEATLQRSMEPGGMFACKSESVPGLVGSSELGGGGLGVDGLGSRKFIQRGMESPCSQASSTSMHSEATHGPLTPPATPAFLTGMVRSSPSQIDRIQRDTAFSRVQMISSPSSDYITPHSDYGLNHSGYSARATVAAPDSYRSYPQIYHHSPYTSGFGAPSSALSHAAAAAVYTNCATTSTNYGLEIGGSDFDRYLDVEDRKLPYVYKTSTTPTGGGGNDHIQELNPVMVAPSTMHHTGNNSNNEQNSHLRINSLSPTAVTTSPGAVSNNHAAMVAVASDTDSISIPNHGGFFYHPDHHLPTYQYWSNNYSTNS